MYIKPHLPARFASAMSLVRRQKGVSLVELVMFVVIVSVAVVGVLSVMNVTNRASADPARRKQAIAIAESLLEEIELQPFTFCDPHDPGASIAANTAGCTIVQGLAANGESRYVEPRFDNVGDYNNFQMNGIRDIFNTPIAGLESFNARVSVSQDGASFNLPNDAALRIDVAVNAASTSITLTGYRFRSAPRAVP
jgi:MSHA pilin protein MshD